MVTSNRTGTLGAFPWRVGKVPEVLRLCPRRRSRGGLIEKIPARVWTTDYDAVGRGGRQVRLRCPASARGTQLLTRNMTRDHTD